VRLAVGPKAAAALQARGDASAARRINDEVDRLRRGDGAGEAGVWSGRGDPTRFGLAVPLSGRAHLLGGAVSRGAMMALGEAAARVDASRPTPQLVLRNTQDDARGPAAAVAELAREEAVLGVVGTPDPRAVEQLGRDGVPFLVLDDEPPGGGGTSFQLVHAPEARAAALAKRAAAAGVRSFAVLAPDSPSGKRLAEAFKRAVTASGGRVAADVGYVAGSTSFAKPIRDLQRAKFDGLFVPEDADRLELVAPALAAADLWARPIAEVTARGGRTPEGNPKARPIVLLSTARGLTAGLVERAGRYVQGALLAPGFFPDASAPDATSGRFVGSYKSLFGAPPGAAEAYAYDGVRVLQACVERGATTREAVLRLLTNDDFAGATGSLRFAADHGRADPPIVYEVAGDEIRALR
jgi:ABC-type branched-subunit amino acid transport system substrate-binding protein